MTYAITFAIIICALVIAFIEKKYLFSPPVTVEKILVLVFLLATAAFSAVKETTNNSQQDHDTKSLDSLKGASKVLNIQIDSFRNENRIAHDSLGSYSRGIIAMLAQYGLQVNSLSNTIVRMDSTLPKEIPPTLTILDVPILAKNRKDSMVVDLIALNSDVHVVEFYTIFINVHNYTSINALIQNRAVFDKPMILPDGAINYSTVIPALKTNGMPVPDELTLLLNMIHGLNDTFYVAFDCTYKSKSGKIQTPPMRKMYLVNRNVPLIQEVDSYSFGYIADILHKKGIWKKLYSL